MSIHDQLQKTQLALDTQQLNLARMHLVTAVQHSRSGNLSARSASIEAARRLLDLVEPATRKE